MLGCLLVIQLPYLLATSSSVSTLLSFVLLGSSGVEAAAAAAATAVATYLLHQRVQAWFFVAPIQMFLKLSDL